MSGFIVAVGKDNAFGEAWKPRWQDSVSSLDRRTPIPIRTHNCGPVLAAYADHPRSLAWLQGDRLILSDGLPFPGTGESNRSLLREHGNDWLSDPLEFARRTAGHFAAVLVDGRQKKLTLVRDRFGVRPLWFLQTEEVIAAASECMMLRPFADTVDLDGRALKESVMCRWIVGGSHLLAPFRQVLPGRVLTLSHSGKEVERRYWSMGFRPDLPPSPVPTYVEGAASALRGGLHDLGVSGEPVAVLLSGGIDSSVVAAMAKDECDEVIGIVGKLPDSPNIETERALFVAEALGIQAMVVDVDADSFSDDFPEMVARLEQPPRNPNNLVLQQLLRAVPDGIRFVLNGDGAEVMFGLADVNRVGQFSSKTAISQRLFPPGPARILAGLLRRSDSSIPWRVARLLDHTPLEFAATLEAIEYTPELTRYLRRWAGSPMDYIPGTDMLEDQGRPFSDRLQEYQTYTFLQSSLIRHDRLSAPLGLEPVFPFLSPSVVEFCLRIPREYRFLEQSKPLLRLLCDRHLPEAVSRWPKLGFPVPWQGWLDGPLKPFRSSLGPEETRGKPFPFGLYGTAERENDHEGIWTILPLDMTWRMFHQKGSRSLPRSA
ncbi:MAG: asparagine synthase-related protein [Longimicrobiales bacterium]